MVKRAIFMVATLLLCGCAPDYISNSPNTVTEALPMTQADTATKLNKICNDVVTSSASLEQQMTKYLSNIVESSVDDKKAIEASILANKDVVKVNIAGVSSFNPAEALANRTTEIKKELLNAENRLNDLDAALKTNDKDKLKETFNSYMSSVSHLKTLSMGM